MPSQKFIEYCKKHGITVEPSDESFHVDVYYSLLKVKIHYFYIPPLANPYDVLEELVVNACTVLNASTKRSLEAKENDLEAFWGWQEGIEFKDFHDALKYWKEGFTVAKPLKRLLGRHLYELDKAR